MLRLLPVLTFVLGFSCCYVIRCPKKTVAAVPDPFIFDTAEIDWPNPKLDASIWIFRNRYEYRVHRVTAPDCDTVWLEQGEPEPHGAWILTLRDKLGRKLTFSLRQTQPPPVKAKDDRPVTDW